MSSTSISSLILFIAAMIVAAGVAGTLVTTVTDVSSSVSTQTGNTADAIDTDIAIISDAGSDAVYDEGDGTVTLYVKNTGEKTLASDGAGLDVLVDGEYVSSEDLEIEIHGDDHWRSGAVAELEIDLVAAGLEDGFGTGEEHRAVVTKNDSRAVFEFRT